jgi:hypothetical protein
VPGAIGRGGAPIEVAGWAPPQAASASVIPGAHTKNVITDVRSEQARWTMLRRERKARRA